MSFLRCLEKRKRKTAWKTSWKPLEVLLKVQENTHAKIKLSKSLKSHSFHHWRSCKKNINGITKNINSIISSYQNWYSTPSSVLSSSSLSINLLLSGLKQVMYLTNILIVHSFTFVNQPVKTLIILTVSKSLRKKLISSPHDDPIDRRTCVSWVLTAICLIPRLILI